MIWLNNRLYWPHFLLCEIEDKMNEQSIWLLMWRCCDIISKSEWTKLRCCILMQSWDAARQRGANSENRGNIFCVCIAQQNKIPLFQCLLSFTARKSKKKLNLLAKLQPFLCRDYNTCSNTANVTEYVYIYMEYTTAGVCLYGRCYCWSMCISILRSMIMLLLTELEVNTRKYLFWHSRHMDRTKWRPCTLNVRTNICHMDRNLGY